MAKRQLMNTEICRGYQVQKEKNSYEPTNYWRLHTTGIKYLQRTTCTNTINFPPSPNKLIDTIKTWTLGQRRPLPTWICSASGVRTQSPDRNPDSRWLPTLNGYFLVQGYIYDKTVVKILSVFPQILSQIAENCNVEESFTKFLDLNPAADDLVHWYICGRIFTKIRSVVFTALQYAGRSFRSRRCPSVCLSVCPSQRELW